jgi:GntR family transcriptional regulator
MPPCTAPGDTLRPSRNVRGVVSHDSPVAPWRQLYGLLRDRIESGELAPGSRLPSLVDLAQAYGVAVTTAQKALGQLKTEGLVITSPMGTFVRKP